MKTEAIIHLKDDKFKAEIHSQKGIVFKVRIPSINRDVTNEVLSNLQATRDAYAKVYQEPVTDGM